MSKKMLVLLNAEAGTLAAAQDGEMARQIRSGLAARGVEADVRAVLTARLADEARGARDSDFDAVVAGGGDGTLNTIASALAGGPKAFGVLPLGTHNHFAKDLLMPLGLDKALAALVAGTVRDLDVAEVNGRLFLNFSGVGFHPRLVEQREAERKARGLRGTLGKFLAMVVAFFEVMRRLPLLRVRLSAGNWSATRLTPSVIVCNNVHQMKVFGLETVSHPDRGMLSVYVARARGPAGLVRLVLGALFRRLHALRDFEVITLPEVRIEAPRWRRLRVSIDGELVDLPTPLHYRVRHEELKVIVPADNGSIRPKPD